MSKNGDALAWMLFGGFLGCILGACKGHSDGYREARYEDMPYIRVLEGENSQLQNKQAELITELWKERRTRTEIQGELERLQKEIPPRIQSR